MTYHGVLAPGQNCSSAFAIQVPAQLVAQVGEVAEVGARELTAANGVALSPLSELLDPALDGCKQLERRRSVRRFPHNVDGAPRARDFVGLFQQC